MKQLLLLRHGESSFSKGRDFERQLTSLGRQKLIRMGENIQNLEFSIDLMYCSTAHRTLETAKLIENYILIKESVFTKEIYDGDLNKMIELLEKTSNSVDSCLVIGHNPVISFLLSHITLESYLGLDPGMLAVVELEIDDWMMIGKGTGSLLELIQ